MRSTTLTTRTCSSGSSCRRIAVADSVSTVGPSPAQARTTAGQQVALQPALAEVLAEDFHHAPVGREVLVGGQRVGVPGAVGGLEERAQAVRRRLVGAEDAEVVGVAADDVAQEGAEHTRRLA